MVDCAGRRSRAPDWLRRIESGLAVDEYLPCDLHYFARHYRLRPGAVFPSTCTPPDDSEVTPYGLFLEMAQVNGTFCLAGALSKSDPCRDRFREESRFDAVMAALPGLGPWLEAGTPMRRQPRSSTRRPGPRWVAPPAQEPGGAVVAVSQRSKRLPDGRSDDGSVRRC